MKRIIQYMVIAGTLFILTRSVIVSWSLSEKGGAVDFRNRVVACRQANLGMNPYEYRWQKGDPETLLDNHDLPNLRFTRMTSSPATLIMFRPWCEYDYQLLKRLNFAGQWLAFVVAVYLLSTLLPTGYQKLAGLAMSAAYADSQFWHYHVERGQQYVYFLALVLALLKSRSQWLKVIYLYCLGLLRLPLAVVGLGLATEAPLNLQKIKSLMMRLLIVSGIAVPLLLQTKWEWWRSYLSAGKDWYVGIEGKRELVTPAMERYPTIVENDPSAGKFSDFDIPMNPYYRASHRLFGGTPPLSAAIVIYLVFIIGTGLIILWRTQRYPATDKTEIFGAVCALLFLSDLVLPAPRGEYNNILALPVILIPFAFGKNSRVLLIMACLIVFTALPYWDQSTGRAMRGGSEWTFMIAAGYLIMRLIMPDKAKNVFKQLGSIDVKKYIRL